MVDQAKSTTDRRCGHHCRDWWGMHCYLFMVLFKSATYLIQVWNIQTKWDFVSSTSHSELTETNFYILLKYEFFVFICKFFKSYSSLNFLPIPYLQSLMSKRKYNVGHRVAQRWVFGGVCRHGRGFLQTVPDRSAATLIPIIREHIAPGTIIHS